MNTRITRFVVPQMSCGSCGHHVRVALGELGGIDKVDIRLSERRVSVQHDADEASVASLVEAIAEAGYDVSQVSSSPVSEGEGG